MNQENLSLLHDNLKYLGFGGKAKMSREVDEMIRNNEKEFKIESDYDFSDTCRMDVSMFFRRADDSDRYYISKYDARVSYADSKLVSRSQTFYVNRGKGVTCKEAFNLLQGRAVYKGLYNKEGEKYFAWLQLNFGEREYGDNYQVLKYYDSYGYDLETVLQRFRIREMQIPALHDALVRSLQRGNIHPVSLIRENEQKRMLIEASPQYKTLNVYPQIRPGQIAGDTTDPDTDPGVVDIPSETDERNLPFWNEEEEVDPGPDPNQELFQDDAPKRKRERKKIA